MATLNSAFGVETSVLSLLDINMWRKLRVGSVMAFFAWYEPRNYIGNLADLLTGVCCCRRSLHQPHFSSTKVPIP
jgi:hypothetical protein